MATIETDILPPSDIPLAAWLTRAGLDGCSIDSMMAEFSERLNRDAGIPVERVYLAMTTLHPLLRARGYTWAAGQGLVDVAAMPHRDAGDEPQAWQESPFRHMLIKWEPEMRRRLTGPQALHDFPVLRDFADQGFSDWIAFAHSFGWDLSIAQRQVGYDAGMGMICSFATRHPEGFSASEIDRLRVLVSLLALTVKAVTLTQLARDVTAAYVGRDAANHVLSGEIRRGMAQKIDAVILYADLRGFTQVADRLAIEPLIEMLNAYFDCLGPAIEENGGQVLKFLGDGLLASFQLAPGQDPAPLCAAALAAAEQSLAAVEKLNAGWRSEGAPTLELDIALHRGTVMYGNVGTSARLDFTLIGPAVNEAARLENLCASLDRNLIASRSFVVSAGGAAKRLRSLGSHTLRGVAEPQEVFTPAGSGSAGH